MNRQLWHDGAFGWRDVPMHCVAYVCMSIWAYASAKAKSKTLMRALCRALSNEEILSMLCVFARYFNNNCQI